LERSVGKPRPVAAYGGIESSSPPRVDAVFTRLDPLNIRAEARAPRKIEGEMDAQSARLGQRIDQPLKRRAHVEREVAALGEPRPRQVRRGEALDETCYRRACTP